MSSTTPRQKSAVGKVLSPHNLNNDDIIPIVDYPEQPYGKVKNAVIYLGGDFYYKSDEKNLIKVKDSTGKKKLYRRSSKLLEEIKKGVFVHKKNIVRTEDGLALDVTDPATVMVKGKYTRLEYCVEVDGELFLKTDTSIVPCAIGGTYIPRINAIKLSENVYKKNRYVHKKYESSLVKVDKTDEVAIKRDCYPLLDKDGEIYYVVANIKNSLSRFEVFLKFRDTTNPQLDRIEYISMLTKYEPYTKIHPELNVRVHEKHYAEVDRIYHDVILVQQAKLTDALKAALKYGDDGPDENMAKIVKKINNSFPGKAALYNPSQWREVISKTCRDLGGLKYTFGLEVETSQGMLNNDAADRLMVKIVGDRSIGAGEYVSPVLHGDDGIKYVKDLCDALAKCTLVDDRCGIHVHIGGMVGINGVAPGDFGRHFSIAAIKLGCQLEEELYRSCPPSRYPTLKHCHSIMRWRDIDDKNWREYLGSYVFGPEETWKYPWSFSDYHYGSPGMSKNDKVDTWCGGRYKWLNLCHILTRSSFTTCELRLFPGSTNFDKIYNYILTSMAFVWFIENRPGLIEKGGCTLSMVFGEAFRKFPEIIKRLNDFYVARTEKFKREGSIYPSVGIPPAIIK